MQSRALRHDWPYHVALTGTTPELRDVWEETSFRLERLQAAEATVAAEQSGLAQRMAPQWRLTYTPEWTPPEKLEAQDKVRLVGKRCHGECTRIHTILGFSDFL